VYVPAKPVAMMSEKSNLLISSNKALLDEAWAERQSQFPSTIRFDYPLKTLAVSLTGSRCELDCAHCGGHYLRHMVPVWQAEAGEATSCLISGGCDKQGRVPVASHLNLVHNLRPGRVMNWHVGLIGREEVEAIAPLVDVVSFDFVGDDETIDEVYGLRKGVGAYAETYRMLCSYSFVIPHITVGLRGGKLSGEYRALDILNELGVEALTFIVFIPTAGTAYAGCQPPPVDEVAELLAHARLRFPSIPIHLGCMRPAGSYRDRLDPLAVRAGVNAIVSPSRAAARRAQQLGLTVERSEECCAVSLSRKVEDERRV
jgi:uncharacterized radical SAM superfamily protein